MSVEQRRARDREYYHKTKDRRRALQRAHYAANKESHLANTRRFVLKTKYGLTPEDVEKMRQEQNNECLICSEGLSNTAIDHCHETGKVRGILCGSCNRALGLFKDSPAVLKNAISYLIERGGKN